VADRETWLTPDQTTGSLELRRFTTSYHKGVRTDFFEVYWADLMEGSTTQQVWAWISDLLLRWPNRVPKTMLSAWVMLWVLSLLAVAFFLLSIFGKAPHWPGPANVYLSVGVGAVGLVSLVWLAVRQNAGASGMAAAVLLPLAVGGLLWCIVPADWASENAAGAWRLIPMALSAGLAFLIHNVLVPYLGDISRYVRAAPDTIASRKAIRERGLELLAELHDSGRYRRIIFAAHSLGCIIAYDLINAFWARRGPTPDNPGGPKTLAALEAIDRYVAWTNSGGTLTPPALDVATFRQSQRAAFEALRSESDNWLISDFVTLGCPLSHAEFLLFEDAAAVMQAKRERLLSVTDTERQNFVATGIRTAGKWFPHHAAPFAVVRWTNIYDSPRAVVFGDLVSGPAVPIFGPGVDDRPVSMKRPFLLGATWTFFTHTLYWDLRNARRTGCLDHIKALREAIAFDDI